MTIGKITWTKYVTHAEVPAYQKAGWSLGNDLKGTHHGHWSQIMKWEGEGDPVVPACEDTVERTLRHGRGT